VRFAGEGDFRIVIKGEELLNGTTPYVFPDADSAAAYAISELNGLQLQRFADIIKIYPAEPKTQKKQANEGW
jgi:hypothetical protein